MNAEELRALRTCALCPRACRVDRLEGERGFCGAGAQARVAAVSLHFGEEPPISGTRGSGTVFFSHCNMACLFCQNYPISQLGNGSEMTVEELAGRLLRLQDQGAHNINFVTPTPHVPHVSASVREAREKGLVIPIVYNTNGYDSLESLALMEGVVEIYLPDVKYRSDGLAALASDTPDYCGHNAGAVAEMVRQVGPLAVNADGVATRGVLIRHLVLPGRVDETEKVLSFIRDAFGREMPVSLMGQYFPAYRAPEYCPPSDSPDAPEFGRRLTKKEYRRAIDFAVRLGLQNVNIQEI